MSAHLLCLSQKYRVAAVIRTILHKARKINAASRTTHSAGVSSRDNRDTMTGYIQNASHWGTFEARHTEGHLDV
ncbi:hypothetical protein, partial [Celeribacter sp.]|uniref:hypothetical protein n=1 Tax=Celeribacter sp. TaxID=1890673 RepID=UPI003A941B5B